MKHENLRLLVVDNMSSIRLLIKAILREMGITSIVDANDGQKALEHLAAQPFDLVICDWDMPKVTGLEVLQQVRSVEKTSSLPFIMLTANSNRDSVSKAIEANVSDYLAKPFKPEDLVNKIKRLFP